MQQDGKDPMICDDSPYVLVQSHYNRSYGIVNLHANCQVFIYISPRKCALWYMKYHTLGEIYFIPEGSLEMFQFTPPNGKRRDNAARWIRSMTFFVIVGRNVMTNLFTTLDLDQTKTCQYTKLQIWVDNSRPEKIVGFYHAFLPGRIEEFLHEADITCSNNAYFGPLCRAQLFHKRRYAYVHIDFNSVLNPNLLGRDVLLHYQKELRV